MIFLVQSVIKIQLKNTTISVIPKTLKPKNWSTWQKKEWVANIVVGSGMNSKPACMGFLLKKCKNVGTCIIMNS